MDRPESEMDMKDAAKAMDDALASLGLSGWTDQEPDEFSAMELASQAGTDPRIVREKLNNEIKAGKWTRRKGRDINGRVVWLYKQV